MSKKEKQIVVIGSLLLVIAFFEFIFLYLLHDKQALKSSIYTYYFDSYYLPLSSGKIPWINFKFEYPPVAAYALLFPGLFPGLSAFTLTALRGAFCLTSSVALLFSINNSKQLHELVKVWSSVLIGILALIVPGFYFGLFDWYLVASNIMIAISLSNPKAKLKAWTWVAIGSTIKLMPLLSIPFLLEKSDKSSKSSFFKISLIVLLVNMPFIIFGFGGLKSFISYHRMRSIDVFSSYACFLNALQNLGAVNITRKWSYGALEVQGSVSQTFAKISLPLFGIVFIALLIFHIKKSGTIKFGFAIYSASIILYGVLSKVSQSNYVLWTIASIISVWIIGYDRPKFIKITSALGIILIAIAFFQDRFFSDFMSALVTWRMIAASSIRHAISLLLVYIILREAIVFGGQHKALRITE